MWSSCISDSSPSNPIVMIVLTPRHALSELAEAKQSSSERLAEADALATERLRELQQARAASSRRDRGTAGAAAVCCAVAVRRAPARVRASKGEGELAQHARVLVGKALDGEVFAAAFAKTDGVFAHGCVVVAQGGLERFIFQRA